MAPQAYHVLIAQIQVGPNEMIHHASIHIHVVVDLDTAWGVANGSLVTDNFSLRISERSP